MTGPREPYLSVVIAARNDNHGGNMLGRMQGMLASWILQAESSGLSSEIVVVEWNPLQDRLRLKDSLAWLPASNRCDVRFIEVPLEVHARFTNGTSIPLHQMIAKNVGIRRARGKFVLATNLDIIFSAQLMQFLAEHRLEEGCMYRIDRHDVARDTPESCSVQALLDFCESHMRRVFSREGEFPLSDNGLRKLEQPDIVAADAGIRFGRGWSPVESCGELRVRWIEREAELFVDGQKAQGSCLTLDADVGPSAGSSPVTIEIMDESRRRLARGILTGRSQIHLHIPTGIVCGKLVLSTRGSDVPLARHPRIVNLRALGIVWESSSKPGGRASEEWQLEVVPAGPAFPWSGTFDAPSPFAHEMRNACYLHTNACGDFTLLSREDWFSLRGYPEFPIWPMHLDAMLCYAAHHAGIRECILREPMRIYHVEHSTGAGWTPEGEQARVARLAATGVAEMSYTTFTRWIDLMRRYNAPITFTMENWGLPGLLLPELTAGR